MTKIYPIFLYFLLLSTLLSCQGQTQTVQTNSSSHKDKLVGGGCDGCELMYAGMPKNINSTDTSAGWVEKVQHLLITGKVFKIDGETPASNVIIYYWQTDNKGYYSPKNGMDEQARSEERRVGKEC